MSLQAVRCSAGHALLLDGEVQDARSDVFVGYLHCPVCREDYMDIRLRNEARIAMKPVKFVQSQLFDARNYEKWIADHQPVDPRGRCADMTKRMAETFPELRRVRGYYTCPIDGRHSHWWLVTPDGVVIDPTADQFASCGAGEYEEYIGPEPTGHCLDCGALLFGAEDFCNAECAASTAEFCLNGGVISVNGRQVYP
jgi:hypothetical protein